MVGIHLLPVFVSLIAGATGQIVLMYDPPPSCHKSFLAGVDVFNLTMLLYIGQSRISEWKEIVNVYLGSPDRPYDTIYCVILLGRSACKPSNLKKGCWCSGIRTPMAYVAHVITPVTPLFADKKFSVEWYSTHVWLPPRTLSTSTLKVHAKPVAYLVVNGDHFDITNTTCPSLPLTQFTLFYFCVENLKDPRLTIWFDTHNHCTFDARCGFMSMALDESYGDKQFWIAYGDACRRVSNVTCRIPPGCCDASSLQVMKAMLAVVAIGYFLKTAST